MNWRSYWYGVLTVYFITAFLTGITMGRIPALNVIGMTYAGLVWPVSMVCVATEIDCDPFPPRPYSDVFWTFDDEAPLQNDQRRRLNQ